MFYGCFKEPTIGLIILIYWLNGSKSDSITSYTWPFFIKFNFYRDSTRLTFCYTFDMLKAFVGILVDHHRLPKCPKTYDFLPIAI